MKQNPIITEDLLEFLKAVLDVPAKASDTNEVLRWKAAQRDSYLRVKAIHDEQQGADALKAKGYNIRHDQ